jgi:hypothetical protein
MMTENPLPDHATEAKTKDLLRNLAAAGNAFAAEMRWACPSEERREGE